jgi:predicted AlkP superfamily pyrophosphatase or phosphodiesterase
MGMAFPHVIGKEKNRTNYRAFTLTPAGNAYVFETAKAAVLGEKMGMREGITDLLAINLSTNDYVGHAFGPYSPEATEVTVQTDRQLADFFQFLQKTVPGGLKEVLCVVTADHGVVPIVEELHEQGMNAARVLEKSVEEAAQKALTTAFGPGNWVGKPEGDAKQAGAYVEPYLYLGEAAVAGALQSGKARTRAEIEQVAAQAVAELPGIYACYTRTQIMLGQLPQNEITRRVLNGFYPKVSGDVVVVSEQMHYTDPGTPGPYATSHGTPYAYDTHVPILMVGPGIRPGVWTERVSPADIAPTLCALLGVELPSGCDGEILHSALR